MKLSSFFSQLFNKKLSQIVTCPVTGKIYEAGKRYDVEGNLLKNPPIGSDPFIGEIVIFAGNIAPANWMFCAGQTLNISTNSPLFYLIGTNFGGNGTSTFALPDLRGRFPIGTGQGNGLSNYTLASKNGEETTSLTTAQMPITSLPLVHPRTIGPVAVGLTEGGLTGNTQSYSNNGGGQTFSNMPPYLGVNFIISLAGTFPSR